MAIFSSSLPAWPGSFNCSHAEAIGTVLCRRLPGIGLLRSDCGHSGSALAASMRAGVDNSCSRHVTRRPPISRIKPPSAIRENFGQRLRSRAEFDTSGQPWRLDIDEAKHRRPSTRSSFTTSQPWAFCVIGNRSCGPGYLRITTQSLARWSDRTSFNCYKLQSTRMNSGEYFLFLRKWRKPRVLRSWIYYRLRLLNRLAEIRESASRRCHMRETG